MSKQKRLIPGKYFDYDTLPPYMQEEFVEERARREAKEVFDDNGNYALYNCKPGEYYVPSYYTRNGKWVMGYCRKFAEGDRRR